MRTKILVRLATVMVLVACASSGSPSANRAQADKVTRAEIAATSAQNAHELIHRLRPKWLRPTNVGSISNMRTQLVLVYLDGVRLGDLESLLTLGANEIQTMEWLDAARAATVLPDTGSDPISGAIVIRTR